MQLLFRKDKEKLLTLKIKKTKNITHYTLLHRLMVGQRTLTPLILVRIQVKQPQFKNRQKWRFFLLFYKRLNWFEDEHILKASFTTSSN